VVPVPKADFNVSPQPTSILEPKLQFTDLSANAVIKYWKWDFGDRAPGDTSVLKNPVYEYADTGSYLVRLFVTTAFGCKDTVYKIIRIDDDYELFVPTAFSPNFDGLNEIFIPVTRGVESSNYKMYVYDRWGNLVFQTDNLYKGWDGFFRGKVVLEDVYVWKIYLKTTLGTSKQVTGHVSVVR
jgi:gliding motility-associated-like protein